MGSWSLVVRMSVPVGLAWLATGCVYIPTFGFGQTSRTDFRVVGDETSSKPGRPGVGRTAIVKRLGEPDLVSADGMTIGYANYSTDAYWIGVVPPFFSYSAHESAEGVKLVFRTDEKLDHVRFVKVAATNSFFAPLGPGREHHATPSLLCVELNAHAPASENLMERRQPLATNRVVPRATTSEAYTPATVTRP